MSEIVGQGISRANLEGAFNNFIEKISNDEQFRDELIANPAEVLARWELNEEELNSIKFSPAWAWLRKMWTAPEGW